MELFVEKYRGKLLPICARPGMGTTSLALQMADFYAQSSEKKVVIFSPKLTKKEMIDRIVCQRLSLDHYDLVKNGFPSEKEQNRFAHEQEQIENSNMQVIESAESTDEGMRQALASMDNVGLVVVDSLDAYKNKITAAALREMAEGMNIPFFITCLVKRSVDCKISKLPKRRDIKIKELSKAPVLYFLKRDFYYDINADENDADLIVDAEERTAVKLTWLGSCMKYSLNGSVQ